MLRLLLAASLVSAVCGQTPQNSPQNIVVTSAASFLVGLPPRGSIGAIFCTGLQVPGLVTAQTIPLPLSLAGISVMVGGAPAPLFAVADDGGYQQINFEVPQEAVFNTDNTAIVVVAQNSNQGSAQVPISTSPGDFFLSSGQLGAFQHSADFSLVTKQNPAQPGEGVVGYLTGLPGTNPIVPTGDPSPQFPLAIVPEPNTAALSDTFVLAASSPVPPNPAALDVLFLGLAPGLAGVYQVNFIVPTSASPGDLTLQLQRDTCHAFFDSCAFSGLLGAVPIVGAGCLRVGGGGSSTVCISTPVLLPVQ